MARQNEDQSIFQWIMDITAGAPLTFSLALVAGCFVLYFVLSVSDVDS